MNAVLEKLDRVIEERRRAAKPEASYVASLEAKGLEGMLRKLSEESTETLLAAKQAEADPGQLPALISETADLWFHSLVLLSRLGGNSNDVLDELARRFDVSGLDEKASRNPVE